MYVHIGGEVTIPADSICAFLSLETVSPYQKSITDFINAEDENNRLQYLTDEIPRTLVITFDRTYVSPLSSGVLKKRAEIGKYA
ncbi:MAG: DUF370 domain-containing protein [Saccharofermentans sp.]|nr:DUF370 domain-containing protein [Saccharofermentans sp.]